MTQLGRPAAGAPHADSVVVQPGETLYAISRRYDVPIRSLIDANGLTPPYGLAAGRRLTLPQVRQHVVQPGDTLYSISRRYGVDTTTLAKANDLAAPYTVKLGTALVLPAPTQRNEIVSAAAATASAAPPARETPRQSVESAALPPPPASRGAGAATEDSRAAPSTSAPAALAAPLPITPSPPGEAAKPVAPPAAAPVQPAPETATAAIAVEPPPAPPKGIRFVWPVRGRVLNPFGPAANGTHNDGVNIAAPLGTPVYAADDGVVAYAGNELRGFGNLVLLKHSDGWMSAYAHCETLLVRKGERVRRGQAIARVGATGSVSEPQLHFELRRGTRALDPTSYLPPAQSASLP